MVKNFVVNCSMNSIKQLNKYDEVELEKIKYGIEATYLGITKIICIFLLSYILGIFKDTLLFFTLYNILRIKAFGLHASKSIYCWIASITAFIGIPFLLKIITIPNLIYYVVSIICLIIFILYAPADTVKRPIIGDKKRKKFKIISCSICLIYSILIIVINNNYYREMLLFAQILESILILPITYKIFKLPYNNYKNYK